MTSHPRRWLSPLLCLFFLITVCCSNSWAAQYKHFRVAVYIPVAVVERMKDPAWLQNAWDTINSQMGVDKVYIETYRSGVIADDKLLEDVKKFFTTHGVQVAGGIAFTRNEGQLFESFCYTDAKDRAYVKNVSEITARHFDEIILDDFFFVMTKTDSDIAAKGAKSWTQFRLDLMDGVAKDLVIAPAKAANPKVKVIIKYPNWYEHFQGLGYDLDKEATMFDGIYTGTETRDPVITDQHLQQYESYQIVRYFDNIRPGLNGGGWVDTYGVRYVDRYAEQLWDTMFAKAPEIMLFNWDLLLEKVNPGDRDSWKSLHTSFDYDQMLAAHGPGAPGPISSAPTMARVAGYSLQQADQAVAHLGNPIGIKSYRPYQSTGEDFLHNYLGMIGIPIDLYPTFSTDANPVLLTESAKFDPDIVTKIKAHLQAGKNVIITSGLLHALQGKGIEDIVELRYTEQKALVHDYLAGFGPGAGSGVGGTKNPDVLIPQIRYLTNDAWALVRGMANGNGFPLLTMDRYSQGTLFVLTIPDNFNDLYALPQNVLTTIKDYILGDFPIRLEAPSQISLFAYDNNTLVIESFLDKEATVTVSATGMSILKNALTGEAITGEAAPVPRFRNPPPQPRTNFKLSVLPHSYVVLAGEK